MIIIMVAIAACCLHSYMFIKQHNYVELPDIITMVTIGLVSFPDARSLSCEGNERASGNETTTGLGSSSVSWWLLTAHCLIKHRTKRRTTRTVTQVLQYSKPHYMYIMHCIILQESSVNWFNCWVIYTTWIASHPGIYCLQYQKWGSDNSHVSRPPGPPYNSQGRHAPEATIINHYYYIMRVQAIPT